MNYPYTQSNLLQQPNSYMYTPFIGNAFLQMYLTSRMENISRHLDSDEGSSDLVDQLLSERALKEIIRLFDSLSDWGGAQFRKYAVPHLTETAEGTDAGVERLAEKAQRLESLSVAESVQTLELLHALNAAQLTTTDGNVRIKIWLDRLVQRFEVSKKLYDVYPPGFRKGAGGNTSVQLYWLFALALSLFHARTSNIKYLSTLLKVGDLLCSLPDVELRKRIPAQGLVTVLATEVTGIQLLAKSKGVAFAIE